MGSESFFFLNSLVLIIQVKWGFDIVQMKTTCSIRTDPLRPKIKQTATNIVLNKDFLENHYWKFCK